VENEGGEEEEEDEEESSGHERMWVRKSHKRSEADGVCGEELWLCNLPELPFSGEFHTPPFLRRLSKRSNIFRYNNFANKCCSS